MISKRQATSLGTSGDPQPGEAMMATSTTMQVAKHGRCLKHQGSTGFKIRKLPRTQKTCVFAHRHPLKFLALLYRESWRLVKENRCTTKSIQDTDTILPHQVSIDLEIHWWCYFYLNLCISTFAPFFWLTLWSSKAFTGTNSGMSALGPTRLLLMQGRSSCTRHGQWCVT